MSNEYQSTSINPDVFEQFLTLLNTHCQSSEESLAMLSTLCFDLMMKCGIQSMTASCSTVWAYQCNFRVLIITTVQPGIFTDLSLD